MIRSTKVKGLQFVSRKEFKIMISYQIQFKKQIDPEAKDNKWPPWDKNVSDQSKKNIEVWEVVATLPSLKAAINSAKVLIKKYGYDRVQICRVTKLNIKVEVES